MNPNVLIIDYDPFAMESRIHVIQNGESADKSSVESSIPELTQKVIQYAKECNVYNVKVRGPLAIISEIKRSITKCEMKMYSENKIMVEGI